MPEAPESVLIGLRAIRETFELRWNPQAKLLKPGSYSVGGILTPPEWDPRWELWDTDPTGGQYMVMRIQTREGEFRPLGQWLVDLMNRLNPAKYDGDVGRMLAALCDGAQDRLEQVADNDFEDLASAAANFAWWARAPKVRSASNARGGQWSAQPATATAAEA